MRLFRTEGLISWTTYFVCPSDTSDEDVRYYALEALVDDPDGARVTDPYVQDIQEIKPTDDLLVVTEMINRDNWERANPFFMGGIEDDELETMTCTEVFTQLKQRYEDALAQAIADAKQLKLPIG